MLRALVHAVVSNHRVWGDSMIGGAGDGIWFFCLDCDKRFYPLLADHSFNDTVKRTPGEHSFWVRREKR